MQIFKQKVLFTEAECNRILNLYHNTSLDGYSKTKSSTYGWINLDEIANKWILERFINWVEFEVNCKVNWGDDIKNEFYFQKYETGDKFEKHTDAKHNRIYTTGLLLNNDFSGGEFVVDTSNNTEVFENKVGNCYMIESILEHQLKEIIKGTRSIVLIFFKKSQIKFNEPSSQLQKII